jgi:large conductance mechanosensitive channel
VLKDFKEFALRGNVVDMAVGIVIGAAFGTVVKSLVSDVMTPPLGLILGDVDFSNLFLTLRAGTPAGPYATLADAQAAGAVALSWGVFLDNVVAFLIVAVAMFFVVRAMVRLQRKVEAPAPAPTTGECPHCRMTIPLGARRCGHCTSTLDTVQA